MNGPVWKKRADAVFFAEENTEWTGKGEETGHRFAEVEIEWVGMAEKKGRQSVQCKKEVCG